MQSVAGNGLFANKSRFRNDFPLLECSVRQIVLKLVDQQKRGERRKERERETRNNCIGNGVINNNDR